MNRSRRGARAASRCLRSLLLALPIVAACGGAAPPAPVPAASLPIDPRVAVVRRPPLPPVAPPKPSASPIDGALPASVEAVLERKAECRAAACPRRALVPEAIAPGAEDQAPVHVWEEILGAGARVSLPRDTEIDLLGVVVRGVVELGSPGEKGSASAGLWSAFRAAGAGLSITAKGDEARVVLVVATSGEPVRAAIASLAAKAKVLAWKERPAPLAIIDLAAQPDLSWDGGARHARLGFEPSTSPRASLGVLLLSKDAGVAEHAHDKEWELLAALESEGDFVMRPGGIEMKIPMRDGSITVVPPGVRHAYQPSARKRTLGIQVYTPPGPEQRFKALAGK